MKKAFGIVCIALAICIFFAVAGITYGIEGLIATGIAFLICLLALIGALLLYGGNNG